MERLTRLTASDAHSFSLVTSLSVGGIGRATKELNSKAHTPFDTYNRHGAIMKHEDATIQLLLTRDFIKWRSSELSLRYASLLRIAGQLGCTKRMRDQNAVRELFMASAW